MLVALEAVPSCLLLFSQDPKTGERLDAERFIRQMMLIGL